MSRAIKIFIIVLLVVVALVCLAFVIYQYEKEKKTVSPIMNQSETEPKISFIFVGEVKEVTKDGFMIFASKNRNLSFLEDREYQVSVNEFTNFIEDRPDLVISTKINKENQLEIETKISTTTTSNFNDLPRESKQIINGRDVPVGSIVRVVANENIMLNNKLTAKLILY